MFRLAVIFLIFLYGCQSLVEPDENSPFYKVPNGSTLVLNRNITIPPYRLKIYIQGGRLFYGANQYYPFCKFELRHVEKHPQSVRADQFTITRIARIADYYVWLERHRLFAGAVFSGGGKGDGKPSPKVYATQMDLRSDSQKQVFRLTCGHLQDPNATARHLSINQIREALGEVFTLQLPPETAPDQSLPR